MIPDSFPNKGRYRVYSPTHDHVGYADTPQYPGQQPIRFPENWPTICCFLEGVRD